GKCNHAEVTWSSDKVRMGVHELFYSMKRDQIRSNACEYEHGVKYNVMRQNGKAIYPWHSC
ncbi:MAG TPA: hypothetical protein VJ184_01335, partial [Chryseolinea sp.]|nr:hypothetical protein [Chryseolinea sp.]